MASLATLTNNLAPPQTHQLSGRSKNVPDEGVKRAVSREVLLPCCRGNGGTAKLATPNDSTGHAVEGGRVGYHCSAPAARYEGERGAYSEHVKHCGNEPSTKGLNTNVPVPYLCSAVSKHVLVSYIQLQGAIGGEIEGFEQNQVDFKFSHTSCLTL